MSSQSAGWGVVRAAAVAVGLLACGGGGQDDTLPAVEAEGDDAGECTDGADNDQDSLFDCDDSDCAGAPDCVVELDPSCQRPLDQLQAFYETCSLSYPDPEPSFECTAELAKVMSCSADCSEDLGCGSIDGTDADAAIALADCLVACTAGDTTPPPDTAFDTGGFPTVKGFYPYAFFGYDPATDVARSFLSNGTAIDASFAFFIFDENYAISNDLDDGCTVFMGFTEAPRATWAGRASGYLFGVDFDPDNATITSNCDAHFGSGATQELFDEIINTGIWSVGLTTTVEADMAAVLETAGLDPATYLGATYMTTSDMVGADSWFGYSKVSVVDANWDVSPGGARESYLDGAEAVQARSDPSIPTTQTPVRALYSVDSATQFVFR